MNNTIKPKGFVCYLNNYVLLKHLSDSEAGQLWKMLYRFALSGEQGEGDTEMVNMLFESFSAKLEEDFAQYAKRVENSRKSGTYKAPNGKSYKVKDGTMYDEDGWDVGRVPSHWDGDW